MFVLMWSSNRLGSVLHWILSKDFVLFLTEFSTMFVLMWAIKPEDYLTKGRQRRTIKPKRFDDHINTNIVENSVKNNTKSFDRIQCNTEPKRFDDYVNTNIVENSGILSKDFVLFLTEFSTMFVLT
jgi:hypothetical protein